MINICTCYNGDNDYQPFSIKYENVSYVIVCKMKVRNEQMEFNHYFDHTMLKPEATEADIQKLCDEAKTYEFASVCVNSCYTAFAADALEDTEIDVCSVVGFPLGAMSTKAKVFEAKNAIEDGADEIDMVMNIGALKEGQDDYVLYDIQEVKKVCTDQVILKVIIETCLLTEDEKKRACQAACEGGADFVKTSTGFSFGGATIEDVKQMKAVVGKNAMIKASGGIRDYETAAALIAAGADRLGTSETVKIMKEYQQKKI